MVRLALAAAVLALAGCGVPTDGSTRTLDAEKVPYGLLRPAPVQSPTPSAPGPAVTVPQVFFLDVDDQLVPQPQPVEASGLEPVVQSLLARLAAGPNEQQRASGLGSALGPGVQLDLLGVADRTASIQVTPSSQTPAADRLPLAVGQVVLTVTSVDGVDRVVFVQDGAPIEAPLPGGARTSQPVSASDYSTLLAGTAERAEKVEPGPSSPPASP
jgi:hypothetical protein